MIILKNNNKTIQISLGTEIKRNTSGNSVFEYLPELPNIKCSDKKDAEYIQQKVNTFINEISQNLLK